MSSTKSYSVEEVLNLTVKNAQHPDFVVVSIKGWEQLPSELREQCILKLRELKNQRDELAQSSAVDANALADKLNQVERPRSATPILPNWEPPDQEETEKRDYEALINDNGRPCYPIELGFDVFDDPQQYKDILNYWQHGTSLKKLVFRYQRSRWEQFRDFQRRNRRYYVPRNRFHEFQRIVLERRRRHGLDGDPQQREKSTDQGKMADWMEYQDYELRGYEELVKSVEDFQKRLASRRRALAEFGYAAFEEMEDLEFGAYYAMSLDREESVSAKKKKHIAERRLEIAKKRLEVAQSEELGESLEPDTWIGWFRKELKSRKTRLDELQHLEDESDRNLKPHIQWFHAKQVEWGEMEEKDPEGGREAIELDAKSADHRKRFEKMEELQSKFSKARTERIGAALDKKFAEEVLEVARSDDLAKTVKRAALIKRTQKEVRFAEVHVEEETHSWERVNHRGLVIDCLAKITSVKTHVKRHEVLLDWIEQQRRELVGECAGAGQEDGPRRSTRARSRALRVSLVTQLSSVDQPATKSGRPRKSAKSILDPVKPAKVIKPSDKKRYPRRQAKVPRGTSQAVEKTIIDSSPAEPASELAVAVKDGVRARLGPVHSSRVSKRAPKKLDRTAEKRQEAVTGEGHARPVNTSTSSKKVTKRSNLN